MINHLRAIFLVFLVISTPLCAYLEPPITLSACLIPDDHPAKKNLDIIFSKPGVLSSLDAMEDAGFEDPWVRPKLLVIGKHPKLKDYLLKVYLDDTPIDAEQEWLDRIEGALLIKQTIEKYDYHSIMRVPKKWIYFLPEKAFQSSALCENPMTSILVVEDMKLTSYNKSRDFYKNQITYAHLDALFLMLIECKLADSLIINNIPLTRSGHIAFVDTEVAGKSPLIWFKIDQVAKYFSPEMRTYWFSLIQKGKPK